MFQGSYPFVLFKLAQSAHTIKNPCSACLTKTLNKEVMIPYLLKILIESLMENDTES